MAIGWCSEIDRIAYCYISIGSISIVYCSVLFLLDVETQWLNGNQKAKGLYQIIIYSNEGGGGGGGGRRRSQRWRFFLMGLRRRSIFIGAVVANPKEIISNVCSYSIYSPVPAVYYSSTNRLPASVDARLFQSTKRDQSRPVFIVVILSPIQWDCLHLFLRSVFFSTNCLLTINVY